MEWDSSWNSGIPVVDEEHQSLVRQVSDLLDTSKAHLVGETLDFLADHVITHFSTEEQLQQTSKYPKAAEHKQAHDAFIADLVGLRAEFFLNDDTMLIVTKIAKFVIDWLNTHIKGEDKEFGDYVKASGLILAPVHREAEKGAS